jgi:hypothetical protein
MLHSYDQNTGQNLNAAIAKRSLKNVPKESTWKQ